MIKITDTFPRISSLFENGTFSPERWEVYINSIYDNCAHIFRDDLKECLDSGAFTYERDILPIIDAVNGNPSAEILHRSFLTATHRLNERILERFGVELDTDIVLYLGLCNAAGWVTCINGTDTVLLGVEKILELNWQGLDSMYGLIYHELGHVYHKQYGVLNQDSEDSSLNFVWQLFTEGIAMYFEQVLVGDTDYFHQDTDGWKDWCDGHSKQIIADFVSDLPTMTTATQRYFGDWADYHGHGDVGYYLGAKFVHHLLGRYELSQLVNLNISEVYKLFLVFADEQQGMPTP